MARRKQIKVLTKDNIKPSIREHSLTKLLIVPVVLVAVVSIAFPEISGFVAKSFTDTFAEVDSVKIIENNVEEDGVLKEGVLKEETETAPNIPQEVSDFDSIYQKNLSVKKVFLEGRRIAPVELLPQNNVSTHHSVRVFLFDDFLSVEECDGLRIVHDKHVKMMSEDPPILCFESLQTLRLNLRNAKKSHVKVSPADFTAGTYCLNVTFSQQVADWLKYNWSHSTAFYPGESNFSSKMAALIQQTTALKKENGGKFQITSYPENIGYKKHTDCMEDNSDLRDRMATVLVYLDDVESGGETSFPELGIWVKPKKGRALVWNNMNEEGKCEQMSMHQANRVNIGHKYILQRWYYYQSFWSLGKRQAPPPLPSRLPDQGYVSCDEYKHGSCRWYDEWSYDVMKEYRNYVKSM